MKIAIAQINPTVGDITANKAKIIDYIGRGADVSADMVVFPELALIGYPPKDLLLKPQFIDDNIAALADIAGACKSTSALVGFACHHKGSTGRRLHNGAALLNNGKLTATYYKQLLPTYDVFDESRYFEATTSQQIVEFGPLKIGLTICEDIWNESLRGEHLLYHARPFAQIADMGVDIVLNISASPFTIGKHDLRCDLFAQQCKQHKLPLIYVNQVGGNDELIFDGNSCAFDSDGQCIAQAKGFAEDMLLVDLDNAQSNRKHKPVKAIESVHAALVLGISDYVTKCGFKNVIVGLSGGIDSAVTAALATEALGSKNVIGVAMPSRYSSQHSIDDAEALADNLGIKLMTIPIEGAHAAMETTLAEAFADYESGLAEENIQARIRGVILMGLSNKYGNLLLTTGNKSELAVGYCTLYGDMAGGLAVISDVPKTMVYELANYINRDREIIPNNTIVKAPSAELKPGQKDQDSLPPYDILDKIIHRYVEQEQSGQEIVEAGFDSDIVSRTIRLIDRSEYKRRQGAPGLKVTSRAFGFGRRMPIAQNYKP